MRVVLHTRVEKHIQEVNKSVSGENGNKSWPFLTTRTRSYLNFRALCSSHLQCPTHCALRTPCAEEEGKVGTEWVVGVEKGGMKGIEREEEEGGIEGGETGME